MVRPVRVDTVDVRGIRGRVITNDSIPIANGWVINDSHIVTPDSSGRFELSASVPGPFAMRTIAVGYRQRRDTLVVPAGRGLDVVVPMAREARCLNILYAVSPVRQRKPWWKWW